MLKRKKSFLAVLAVVVIVCVALGLPYAVTEAHRLKAKKLTSLAIASQPLRESNDNASYYAQVSIVYLLYLLLLLLVILIYVQMRRRRSMEP